MTAEVAIVNRHAIALAADSAVTVGRERVWKYANKLFSCGPHNDIGIMIYNSGDFLGVPWETVVKEFRRHCGARLFDTVSDFADHLVNFVKSDKLSDDDEEDTSFKFIMYNTIDNIKDNLHQVRSAKDFNNNIDVMLSARLEAFKKSERIFIIDRAQFDNKYSNTIKALVLDIFKQRKIDAHLIPKFIDYLFEWISRENGSDLSSGVVVAGYGADELFPSIVHYEFDGKALGCTRVWKRNTWNYNKSADKVSGGRIIPFAQKDMLYLFMEGVSVNNLAFLHNAVSGILRKKSKALIDEYVKDESQKTIEHTKHDAENETILEAFFDEFTKYREKSTINQTMRTITSFPKEEMASMAEALVELTALKRKIGPSLETVGGPVDVAVISKGDGFIWIKRKHYFKIDHNMDFSERKKLRVGKGAP